MSNRREPAPWRYGFEWGPMDVTRIAHIEGKGYVLEVLTDHARLQIKVSEQGRKITAHPIQNAGVAW